uniref:Uncharacterized protein n=1 Tax=Arundo donax TaxID=35708 RepID=A0A0A9G9R5_ARUDO
MYKLARVCTFKAATRDIILSYGSSSMARRPCYQDRTPLLLSLASNPPVPPCPQISTSWLWAPSIEGIEDERD